MKQPSVTLIYDRRKDGNNSFEYKVYFPADKKAIYLPCGVSVDAEHYDRELNAIDPDAKDYLNIRNALKAFDHNIKDILAELSVQSNVVTKDMFRAEFDRRKDVEADKQEEYEGDFNSFFLKEAEEDNSISESTRNNYLITAKTLKAYKDTIPFDEIGFKLAHELGKHLREKYTNANTVTKHFIILKKYVRLASKFGLITMENANSFIMFKTSTQQTHKEVLTAEEINKVMALEYPEGSNEHTVQAMFLFSFFTALRVSDVSSLSVTHFHKDDEGLHLNIQVKKLQRYNRVIRQNLSKSFSGEAERVIRPFLDKAKDKLFKRILEKEILIALSNIIEAAGIYKHITFHCARHSGLTMVAHLTQDPYSVMEFGAITNIQTAQRYTHLAEDMFKNKIENIKWDYSRT